MTTKKPKKITGIQELGDCSFSFQYGCTCNCVYCWAHKMAKRFNRVPAAGWDHPQLKPYIKIHDLPHDKSVVCFGTHDIDETNVNEAIHWIWILINRGNHIIIVSKPRLKCIQQLIEEFMDLPRDRLEFIFTIGSQDDGTLKMWERNTTGFSERMECTGWTLCNNFKTSVLCEPLLDELILSCNLIERLLELKVSTMGRDSPDGQLTAVWIGAMKYIHNAPLLNYTLIYNRYKDNPRIKFKESFRKHLGIK